MPLHQPDNVEPQKDQVLQANVARLSPKRQTKKHQEGLWKVKKQNQKKCYLRREKSIKISNIANIS